MTSIIKLTALSGVQGEGPPCYMLQVDEFRFLLDCGWDEKFSMDHIESIKKHLNQIDAVLLSYPDPLHLGALPYLIGKCNLSCPVYATIPVYKMGQMFMYDLYQSRHNTEDFDLFTLDDVDAAFDKITQLKYSQTVSLKGKGYGLKITPVPAGHMIGGTIWKIVKDGEEEIVYAIDYNHKKERHLNGCVLDTIQRPTLLITDAFNASYNQARRRLRDEQLMTQIVTTVRGDGNVLIALDTAGRVLELAHLLDQMWRSQGSGLMAYSLAMLNNVSYNVVEFAKSQVEWMSDKIMRAFEDARNNPFQFKHVQLCHSLAELNKVPDPKVVLASVPDLECGFSRDLFIQWCDNPKNTIILTNRTPPGTLARKLIDDPTIKSIPLEIRRRVRLEGEELEEYNLKKKEKDAEKIKKKTTEEGKKVVEDESSDESDAEMETDQRVSKPKHDLMMKPEAKARTGFFKQAKKAYPMFPMSEDRIKWDDYGELIRADDFTIQDVSPMEEDGSKEKTAIKAEKEAAVEVVEVPTKCVRSLQTLEINANVTFIDFEGRSDGESMKKILAQIKPRQLILVHGDEKSTKQLCEFARNTRDIVQGKVYMPMLNEVVDATKESHIFQVKLKDSLVSSLQFHKARDTELAWLDALVNLTAAKTDTSAKVVSLTTDTSAKGQRTDDDDVEMRESEAADMVPTLLTLQQSRIPGHKAVFINEPRLSDFKQVLIKEGVSAEFNGGVLVCNNQIAVRRNEAGRMQIEGCLCEDYYKIRKLLYSQYAIV